MARPYRITYQVTVVRVAHDDKAAQNQASEAYRQLCGAVVAAVGGTEHTIELQHVQPTERRRTDRREAR